MSKRSKTTLVALLALASGAQALSPASAGAMTAQGTGSTCVHQDWLPAGSGIRSDGTFCTILTTSGGGTAGDSGTGTSPKPDSPGELQGEIIEVQSLGPGDCDVWPTGARCSGPQRTGEQRPRRDPDVARPVRPGRPPAPQKSQRPAQSAAVRKSCEDMAAKLRKLARPLIAEALTTVRPADGKMPFKARGSKSYMNDYLNAKGLLESDDPTMRAFGEWGTRVLDNIRNLVRDYRKCQGVWHRNRWTLGSSPLSTA